MYYINMNKSEVLPVLTTMHFIALFRVVLRLTEISVQLIGYCPRKIPAHLIIIFFFTKS